MRSEITLQYSEALVRASVGRYWRRFIGWRFVLALGVVAACLGYLLWTGDRSWQVGVMGAVLLIAALMAVAVYAFQFRRSMGAFRRLPEGRASVVFDDDRVRLSSPLGVVEIPWSGVKQLWRYPEVWLMLIGNSYATLPLRDLPEPVQTFVAERVAAAGGKVR